MNIIPVRARTKGATLQAFFLCLLVFAAGGFAPASASPRLFGYKEEPQTDMSYLPQWLHVLERHLVEDVPEGDCKETLFNRCHLNEWFAFLEKTKHLPPAKQIDAVNTYANKKSYVLDISNYGVEDYWAVAKEFLYNGGDCEDYAITKFFSLKWLGFNMKDVRLVVLQDTNLRIPHAVLAVFLKNDILVLDNQSQEVVSHRKIVHYVPLYSVNEEKWWLHLPTTM